LGPEDHRLSAHSRLISSEKMSKNAHQPPGRWGD
jgi:hypothetical protein